jgi:ABC-type amino acid transport substrate-binding protein
MAIFGMMLWQIGCATADDSWERVQTAGVLRVGLDPTYPPFEVDDGSGNLVGLDVDLAKAIADDLGLEVQFVYFGYDGLYDALATEQVDVLISALVIIPERTRDFSYSEPYFNAGEILIVPANNETITSMADLGGQTAGGGVGQPGPCRGHRVGQAGGRFGDCDVCDGR